MSKQEKYIEADIDKQMAEALAQTGTGCITTETGITFIDYFHVTKEDAEARIKEGLKR